MLLGELDGNKVLSLGSYHSLWCPFLQKIEWLLSLLCLFMMWKRKIRLYAGNLLLMAIDWILQGSLCFSFQVIVYPSDATTGFFSPKFLFVAFALYSCHPLLSNLFSPIIHLFYLLFGFHFQTLAFPIPDRETHTHFLLLSTFSLCGPSLS